MYRPVLADVDLKTKLKRQLIGQWIGRRKTLRDILDLEVS